MGALWWGGRERQSVPGPGSAVHHLALPQPAWPSRSCPTTRPCPHSNPIWMVATRMQAMSRTKQQPRQAAAAAAAEAGQEGEPELPPARPSILSGGVAP